MIKGSNRDKRALLAEKAPRTKTGVGLPNKVEGNDGDFQVRQVNNKVKLFVKYKGIWHGVNIGKSFDKIEEKSAKALTSKDIFLNRKQVSTNNIKSDNNLTLDVAGDITLSADGNNIFMDNGTTRTFDFNTNTSALKIMDETDTTDFCSISVGPSGATIISTTDGDGAAAARLTLVPDGKIELKPVADTGVEVTGCIGFVRTANFDHNDATIDFRDTQKAHLDLSSGHANGGGVLNVVFPEVSGNFTLVIQHHTSAYTVASWRAQDTAGNATDDGGTAGAIRWQGGSAPTLTDGSVTNGARDIVSFYWDKTEEVTYGMVSLDFRAP